MPTADEVWAFAATPLENLRSGVNEQPDVPWPQRRADLHTELAGAVQENIVERLLTWLDDLSDTDRTELLTSDDLPAYAYRVIGAAVGAQPAAERQHEYDENTWFAYLAEHGARWDGTAESWDGFRVWLVHHATEAGVGTPAGLLVDYLGPMAVADRITMLGQYGVAITRPETAEVTSDPRVQQVMARLLARKPQYADIPEARRIELVNEFLRKRGEAS